MGIQEDLLKSIRTITEGAISSAPFDKTRKAQILSIDSDNTCKIRMDGVEYPRVKVYGNVSGLMINQIVRVIIPENQPSQMFILSPIANANDLGKFGIGTITSYAGKIGGNWDKDFPPPNGWLLCDGSAVSRTTFDKLFEVIGTTYGAGNGSTTFNLPNLSGRTAFGVNGDDADFDLGDTGGSKTHTPNGTNSGGAVQGHTLTSAESGLPAHTHNAYLQVTSQALGSGSTFARLNPGSSTKSECVVINNNTAKDASTAHTHDFTQPTFTGNEQNTMPPYLTLNYIICYKPIGGNGGGGSNPDSGGSEDTTQGSGVLVTRKTYDEWSSVEEEYIPINGEFCVYTTMINSNGIPVLQEGLKIGDGETLLKDIPFVGAGIGTIDKLNHKLTIGDAVFDGSEDVTIRIYGGDYE